MIQQRYNSTTPAEWSFPACIMNEYSEKVKHYEFECFLLIFSILLLRRPYNIHRVGHADPTGIQGRRLCFSLCGEEYSPGVDKKST